MTDLSKRMREIASKATVAPSQGPEVCTMHAVDFDDQPKYWRCALGDGVLSLCAEIEDLEQKHDATEYAAREMLKAVSRALVDTGIVEGIVIEPMTLIDVVGFVCDGIKKIETELAYERDARRLRVKQTSFAHGGHPEGWSVYNETDRRLSRSGDWDYQPLPSSRSAEWIAEHSWPTMRAAVDAARKAEAK